MTCIVNLQDSPRLFLEVRLRTATAAWVMALALAAFGMVATSAEAQTYKVVHIFTTGTDGADPYASLLLDRTGLYGTTYAGGGPFDGGTVFKIDKTGTEKVLHRFRGWGGVHDGGGVGLQGGLVRDPAGNLYSTTVAGGANDIGTVFKLDSSGKETVLHSFAGPEGSYPYAGLIRDAGGNLYGTTLGDVHCTYGCGTVFKLDRAGKVTLLYSFKGGTDGAQPYGGLVRDNEGNLYGTTLAGGSSNCDGEGCGIAFRLDMNGKETILHIFTGGSDGGNVFDGLVRNSAGNLYGTTSSGGSSPEYGIVFKLDPSGQETVLYNFTGGTDGGSPYSGLVQDVKGNLYGTTVFGGDLSCSVDGVAPGCGTVFKLDTTGRETVLYSFTGGRDGATPIGGLVIDSAGNFYGTASQRGDLSCGSGIGCGVVFDLTP
jgi:uncharacterized repeat protein (TIGR03803 family)